MPKVIIALAISGVACILVYAQQEQPAPKIPASLPELKPDAGGKISQEQMQRSFRVGAEKRLRNYTYIERDEEHKLDGKGQVKSTEVKTYDILDLYGEQVQRLIEKDEKTLDAKNAAKEEEKIQKIIDKRKNESEDARRKREQKDGMRRQPPIRLGRATTQNQQSWQQTGPLSAGSVCAISLGALWP